jgi:hypothetical protein
MRPVAPILAAALAAALALAAAPAVASEPAGPVMIAFEVAGTTDDPRVARGTFSVTGRFSMTGSLADAGTVRTTYRLAGPYVGGSAMVIGARGIFTISMRGMLGPVVDARQSAAGRWRLCGGTGAYRHARASGLWEPVADLRAAPGGMRPPAMRGGFHGRLVRASLARPPGSRGVPCTPGVT